MSQDADALFLEALQIPAGAERAAFLDVACKDDAELRRGLEVILADDGAADAFFDELDTVGPPSAGCSIPGEEPGDIIGRFKLLEIIGEGGFGTVWMAEQSEPVQRRVALKIIRVGMDTREFIARFEQERQALAMMDHPNIARVLDGGATPGGRPYFVMELVHGVPITKFCDEQKLPLAARLDLFIEVCHAIQHAHQKGLIHRDIKPSNVMVTLDGDKAVPKVIDFGIAKATQGKLTDKTLATRFEQFIGTPVYMSPEQAGMGGLDIDTRSDTYSLGILLYELLTGKPPFDAKSLAAAGHEEMRRIIREVEPPKPSSKLGTVAGDERTTLAEARHLDPAKLSGMVEPDLDWIVMKAIEKDRSRRYETVNGLALDIQRFLSSEPVSAGPPTARYRFRKFARRNKTALRVAAGIAALLVAATAVSSWQAVRATDAQKLATEAKDLANDRLAQVVAERDQKEQARKDAEDISTFLGEVFQSPDPARDGRTIKVAELLDKAAKKLETDLASQPNRRARLQQTLGRTYHALGLPREAIPLQEKARDYFLAVLGPEHPNTLGAMFELASSYHAAGHREAALDLGEEVLKLTRKVLGPEHSATLNAMMNLAHSYDDADRREEALTMREKVLALRSKVSGPEHPDTLKAMYNLAKSYEGASRVEEAITLREKVLRVSRKVLVPEHPHTLTAMSGLAVSYATARRWDEALKLQEEVLPLLRKSLGPEHPTTLLTMTNLANSYDALGRRDEALKLGEEVLTLSRKSNDPEHPDTIMAMMNLAASYNDAGRREESLKMKEEVLTLGRKVLGPEHTVTLTAMYNLAISYSSAGRQDDAIKLGEEVLPLSRKINGAEHPTTLATMTNLASSYGKAGHRLAEAIELQEQSLAIKRRVLPPDHQYLSAALANMANLYQKDGRKVEAQALRKELAGKANPSPPTSPPAPAPVSETKMTTGPKPRPDVPATAGSLVPPDSEWKWLHPTDGKDPAEKVPGFHTNFFLRTFDDSAWKTGKDSDGPTGGFGYGLRFTGVDIGWPEDKAHRLTAYFRHAFTTDTTHTHLELRCQRDDGIIVYLDGKEVIRDNVEPGGDAYRLHATEGIDEDEDSVVQRYPLPGALAPGSHLLAISLHNVAPSSTDLRLGGVTLVAGSGSKAQ